MSRTYDLACHDCKVAIWIGQASHGEDRGHIVTEGKHKTLLNDFLWDHMGHSLEFCQDTKLDDYREIEPEEMAANTIFSELDGSALYHVSEGGIRSFAPTDEMTESEQEPQTYRIYHPSYTGG